MKNKEINKVFNRIFITFLKEVMWSCDRLANKIEDCKTYDDLGRCLESNVNEIADALGYECEECENKDYEIRNLSGENRSLVDELEHSYIPKTLNDQYKLEAFVKAKDNFTVSEFESLMS